MNSTSTQTHTWVIDPTHSNIFFEAKHLLISTVTGWFRQFKGIVITDGEGFDDCRLELAMYAQSVCSGSEERDRHLRSVDFLDAENFPLLRFVSEKVEQVNGSDFVLSGTLQIRDVQQPLQLQLKHCGTTNDPFGNTKAGFEAGATFNRKDFGITWNTYFDKGGILIADEVHIHADIQLLRIS